ncbi:glycosyltransferase [Pigmentiphaga aceris]|uniref:Glycosyltransferase n=1 Tax=Pigmentiphaga aceris TaxID=1940612 RepID=A0A5C0B356_9BURK|nr:glycosyltransferase [Pigmentiphaga aceris]QEI07191.1 glycosyltransferase [Pigmentiphaga aceris]
MTTKILTFVGHYLPGHKSGGQLRTIANMVDTLSDDFEFWIVTRDRDLGDAEPYPGVTRNCWNQVGRARVCYVDNEAPFAAIQALIEQTPHDAIYLNSFFDRRFSILPLMLRRFARVSDAPLFLAPRGEFSPGALALKPWRKRAYIFLAGLLGLYRDATFQAASEHEKLAILNVLKLPAEAVEIAIDLPRRYAEAAVPAVVPTVEESSDQTATRSVKLVFLSRISRKKNLDFALCVLALVQADVSFDIYGPVEDGEYWAECRALAKALPANVRVTYCGDAPAEDVERIFSRYDLFLFPTRGESYGQVIGECLSVGTPVLVSDQTPWLNLAAEGLGWDVPLDAPEVFARRIDELAALDVGQRRQGRERVRARARERLSDPKVIEANRALFNSVLRRWRVARGLPDASA